MHLLYIKIISFALYILNNCIDFGTILESYPGVAIAFISSIIVLHIANSVVIHVVLT